MRVLAVAVVVFVALPFLREPATASDVSTSRAADDGCASQLMEERDRALAALKELEFDHRTGKVDDDDYRASSGPLRRAAADALQALDRCNARQSAEEELGRAGRRSARRSRRSRRSATARCGRVLTSGAHQVPAGGEADERDQGERDAEREHDL